MSEVGPMSVNVSRPIEISEEWGAFEIGAREFARWVNEGLGDGWSIREVTLSKAQAQALVARSQRLDRYLCVPLGRWTALFTNGPRGTDVGLFPSYAARELGRRAVRIVDRSDADATARILTVYAPDGTPPLLIRRSLAAARDGSRWVFEQTGEAFAFEDTSAYARRRVADRLTSDMLAEYLDQLGVPAVPLDWSAALLIENHTAE